jgi:glycosyltransferase involved in cell wall biosynthesis
VRIGIIGPVSRTIPPAASGAIELYVETFARALIGAGCEVTLAATADSHSVAPIISHLPNAEIRTQGNVSREFLHAKFAYDAFADFDVIVDFTAVGPLLVHPTSPIICAFVNGGLLKNPQDLARRSIYEKCEAEILLFVSSNAQKTVSPELSRAHVIVTGIDIDDCAIDEPRTNALFIGTLDESSQIDVAINTAKWANFPLSIVGRAQSAREQKTFDALIKPELNDSISYAGEVSNDDLHEYLRHATVLLLPQPERESSGILLLNSLAHGVPILTIQNEFTNEYLRDGTTAVLVETPEDFESGYQKATALDRSECRAVVNRDFTSARFAQQFLDLISSR